MTTIKQNEYFMLQHITTLDGPCIDTTYYSDRLKMKSYIIKTVTYPYTYESSKQYSGNESSENECSKKEDCSKKYDDKVNKMRQILNTHFKKCKKLFDQNKSIIINIIDLFPENYDDYDDFYIISPINLELYTKSNDEVSLSDTRRMINSMILGS
jgi:hypothetical protein